MENMFSYCYSLTSLDLSYFNTRQIRSMSKMFMGCENLQKLNLNSFNTE